MNKFISAVAGFCVVACGVFGFSACEGGHTHDFTGDYVQAENGHARKCAVEGCTEVGATVEQHGWVADTEKTDIAATCHSDGTHYIKCPDCGAESSEAVTERPAHDFTGNWIAAEDGSGHYKVCRNDGCTQTDTAQNHNWVADTEKTDIAATCHSDGTHYIKCSDCGAESSEAVTERPAHDFTGDYVQAENGHTRKCAAEGCTEVSATVEQHGWDQGIVTEQPTFWTDGLKTVTCEDCGHTKSESVAALEKTSHKSEFTVDEERDGDWSYGKFEISKWDAEDFGYTKIPATGTTSDAHTGEGVEIKADWLSGGCAYIAYTFKENATLKFKFTVNQVDGGKKMDVRTVVGNVARFHGEYNGSELSFDETYTLSAGETVYFVFTPQSGEGNEQIKFEIDVEKTAA